VSKSFLIEILFTITRDTIVHQPPHQPHPQPEPHPLELSQVFVVYEKLSLSVQIVTVAPSVVE
ncbi:MAG: hypothetical protein ACOZBL_05700, partial [Patescibacteria group bacterium]